MFSSKLAAIQALFVLTISFVVHAPGCSTSAPDSKVTGADSEGADNKGEAKASGADQAGHSATSRDGGTGVAASDAAEGGNVATFTMIYGEIFQKFCNADFCHGSSKPDFFDVSSKRAAYDSLVNAPASSTRKCADSGLLRVVPGEPESSLLRLKLRTMGTPCGQQMPIGGELRPELQMLIEQWIREGAHDN